MRLIPVPAETCQENDRHPLRPLSNTYLYISYRKIGKMQDLDFTPLSFAACNIKCERTRNTRTRVNRLFRTSFFISQYATRSNRNGVKNGAAVQIYKLSGSQADFRPIPEQRPGGRHCGGPWRYSGGGVPGVEARRNGRTRPQPAESIQPRSCPAETSREFQAAREARGRHSRRVIK